MIKNFIRILVLFLLVIVCDSFADNQNELAIPDSSNLPIITIDTQGQEIVDDPKIIAKMKVFYNENGRYNKLTDIASYDGFIAIELRGHFSQWFPQRPYALETQDSAGENLNVSLLGMPKENDWILTPNYDDKSFCRNIISFDMFRKMGQYATRAKLCEVIVNNDYRGIYVFCEKIKPDKNRVNIDQLSQADTLIPNVTGGYILKVDYYESGESFSSSYGPFYYPDRRVRYNYVYPDMNEISSKQKIYIKNFIKVAEGSLYGDNYKDPQVGYEKYVDVASFIDYFIVSEVSRNVDGYKKSRFFYKDRVGKDSLLRAGPVWDFDWAWKNITEYIFANTDGSGWGYKTNDYNSGYACPDWHIRLLQDGKFTNRLIERYQSLRNDLLSFDGINSFIDSVANYVSEAKVRHFKKYPINTPNPAPEVEPPSKTYAEEIARLKEWIRKRIVWLDTNIPLLRQNIIQDSDTSMIPIENPGFELPGTEKVKGWDGVCADAGWGGLLYDIPGWSSDEPSYDSGVEDNQGATEGTWTAFVMGGDSPVYQVTNYLINPDDVIGLKVDARVTFAADKFKMSLLYMNDAQEKVPLISKEYELTNDMAEFDITLYCKDYRTAANKKLIIQFDNTSTSNDSWIGLDNVRLLKYTPTDVEQAENMNFDFNLEQNYPNPFNPSTVISYQLAVNSQVSLKVYDILGREVSVLVNGEQAKGNHKVSFSGKGFSSGVYIYVLKAGNNIFSKKMTLLL